MAKTDLNTDALVQRLHDEARESRQQLERAEAELDSASDVDGVADGADQAVRTTVGDDLLARIERTRDHLDEVERALSRVEAGTYGLCAVDGEPIEAARLDAVPWAEFCLKHQPDSTDSAPPPTL